jgi:hypothetical protein
MADVTDVEMAEKQPAAAIKRPSKAAKLGKAIAGHESMAPHMEEGGIFFETKKALFPNLGGSTLHKVFYIILFILGFVQFWLGFADAVNAAAKVTSKVEISVQDSIDFPSVFVCMDTYMYEASVGNFENPSIYFRDCADEASCLKDCRGEASSLKECTSTHVPAFNVGLEKLMADNAKVQQVMTQLQTGMQTGACKGAVDCLFPASSGKPDRFDWTCVSQAEKNAENGPEPVCKSDGGPNPRHCGNMQAEFLDGVFPAAQTGRCIDVEGGNKVAMRLKFGPLLEQLSAPPQQGGLGVPLAAPMSSVGKKAKMLQDAFNGIYTCMIMNDAGALTSTRKNNRELHLTLTQKKIISKADFPVGDTEGKFLGVIGFFEQGTDPVDKNGIVTATYNKVGLQNWGNNIGLSYDTEIDQTEIYRWSGRPGPTEGKVTQRWKMNSNSFKMRNEPNNSYPSYPQTRFIFNIDDFVTRTITSSRPSASEVLNALGGSIALCMGIVALAFRSETVSAASGKTHSVTVFKYQKKDVAAATAKQYCVENVADFVPAKAGAKGDTSA